MSHKQKNINQSKPANHSTARSVIYHRSYHPHLIKPQSNIHFIALLTTEHKSHNLPPYYNTSHIHCACAIPPKNVNKHSVVHATSTHQHCTKQPQTHATQYLPTPEHILHAPPIRYTTLHRCLCVCAELCTLTKTSKNNLILFIHIYHRSDIVNSISILLHINIRTKSAHFLTVRYNVSLGNLSHTGNLVYKKIRAFITEAGIRIYNGK